MSAHMDHKTSSSSEDGIEKQRLVDADWNHNSRDAVKGRATQTDKSDKNSRTRHLIMSEVKKPSIREMIYQESYDQLNEDHKNMKATPEFKSFLAKKLSSALDGKLKMTVPEKEKTFNDENSKKNEEDTFRLFSSSCCAPNLNTPESAPHVKRKRPRIRRNTKKLSQDNYDDSDSDVIDQRLAEAAISGNEILSFSALSTPTGHNAEEVQYSSSDDSASHLQSKRTRTVDDALIKKEIGFKHTEVGDDEFLQENVKKKNKKKKKKKKEDTNAIHDDGHEQVQAENCLTQIVSSSELLKENEQDDLSEKNIQKKKKKRKKMDTNAIDGNDYEQLKGESCLTQMVSSTDVLKGKDRADSSEEIVKKNKKKMKKRVDTNASNGDDH
ncbi:uncharacterized protein LOC105446953 isoform X2 [Strongylocentrotus purpuratus]|uniref:Protein CUSTOS n=1 Tax=Strongylocentrotus purpuratus TaxID=7668 RepID=A0A7M7P975_STRPU|nr:uncharacterized protein LOC105446953 isoform X2 [Strongylocentrotus purpuratus]